MATILPNQIPPITVPLLGPNGMMEQNWWLFLYNMAQQVLGNQNTTTPIVALQLTADNETDAQTIDYLPLVQRLSNLEEQISDPEQYATISAVQQALQLAQSGIEPDPLPRAQPVQVVSVGASPFVYTAAFNGMLLVTGGTVSAIALNRGAGFITTGLTAGFIPVRRQDQVQVTYVVSPAMDFYPN